MDDHTQNGGGAPGRNGDAPGRNGGALGRSVSAAAMPDVQAREFADALMAFLSASRRTRGRLQPLFDDITVPQLVLLDAIEECGRDGVGAVAVLTGLSQPTVTRSAGALVRDGLVCYGETNGDGRRRVLELTPRGSTLLAAKRAVVSGHLAGAWDNLSPAEQALVVPLLRHLTELVDKLF